MNPAVKRQKGNVTAFYFCSFFEDLREAVMACFSGGQSRRWTVLELVERLKTWASVPHALSVTAALAELALELELSGWAPWRLLERGTEWILAPKSELLKLLDVMLQRLV